MINKGTITRSKSSKIGVKEVDVEEIFIGFLRKGLLFKEKP